MHTSRSVEFQTLALIVGCYILWILAAFAWTTGIWWLGVILMPWLVAFHTSLQHETIHGHPTRWLWFNELLVSLPLGVVFPLSPLSSIASCTPQ